jgi:dihydrofolate reductase
VYGRRIYEVMRYWDEDDPEWGAEQREFAVAWRRQPKWVVSRSLKSLGPNATLVADNVEAVMRGLKAQLAGEVAVGGPDLARSLTDLGLIDAKHDGAEVESILSHSSPAPGRRSVLWPAI